MQVAWWLRDEMRREVIHPSPTDAQIKKAIEDAFTYDPRLQTTPEVDVENGTAILTGEVGNIKSKQAAEQVATHSIGVKRV
ncbi:MAG: BON domain-containing protein, partial [Aliifodinibius sp.]|nr:BON domain-containing protein [Fodinibius sp.]NIY24845.1 BON domain-containing protein [Fodinibius sp.]